MLFTDAVILARAQTNFELVQTGPRQQVGEIARDWAPLYGTMTAAWLCSSAGSRASCSGAIENCVGLEVPAEHRPRDREDAFRSDEVGGEVGGKERLEGGIAHVESTA